MGTALNVSSRHRLYMILGIGGAILRTLSIPWMQPLFKSKVKSLAWPFALHMVTTNFALSCWLSTSSTSQIFIYPVTVYFQDHAPRGVLPHPEVATSSPEAFPITVCLTYKGNQNTTQGNLGPAVFPVNSSHQTCLLKQGSAFPGINQDIGQAWFLRDPLTCAPFFPVYMECCFCLVHLPHSFG